MKIGVQGWGTEGDLRPMIALARGLASAGHSVTLALTDIMGRNFRRLVGSLPVTLWPVGQSEATAETFRRIGPQVGKERAPLRQIQLILRHFMEPIAGELLAAAKALCKENDAVVGHFLLHPLGIAAIEHNRPRVAIFTAPAHPSKHYLVAGMPNLGRTLNGLVWAMGRHATRWTYGPPIDAMYRQEGLEPPKEIIRDAWGSSLLNLVAVSPSLFPQPPDWDGNTQVCGSFELDGAPAWSMPDSLRAFLEAGPAPVYMTFGSMMAGEEDPAQTVSTMFEAAGLAGCRTIIQADWGAVQGLAGHDAIYRLERAPHGAIFPHCVAVVHHGGAGTTHAATRAGCPSVVVPFVADQLFWAGRLRSLGIAGAPVKRASLTAKKLSRAIRAVLAAPEMGKRAGRLAEQMGQEDGIRQAVSLIESRCQ